MTATSGTVPSKSRAKRPQPKGGSRKGIPNKVTKELKDMIIGALNNAGGEQYLTERAKDPKTQAAFLTLLGKTLPLNMTGTANLVVTLRPDDAD